MAPASAASRAPRRAFPAAGSVRVSSYYELQLLAERRAVDIVAGPLREFGLPRPLPLRETVTGTSAVLLDTGIETTLGLQIAAMPAACAWVQPWLSKYCIAWLMRPCKLAGVEALVGVGPDGPADRPGLPVPGVRAPPICRCSPGRIRFGLSR